MSAEQNIETAGQMYQAFGRGDVQAILDLVTDAAIPSAPWSGPGTARTASSASSKPSARPGRSPRSPCWPTPATTTAMSWCSSATRSRSPRPAGTPR